MSNLLVDISGFRQKNSLKQTDLASFLGTTRGYISVLESKRGVLSAKKIDMILERWGVCGLVPCYDRLVQLNVELVKQSYLEPRTLSNDYLPFEDILSKSVVTNIKYGKIGISDELANKIIAEFPHVNKTWLIEGSGNMFFDDTTARLGVIEAKLDLLLSKIDLILGRLNA